MRISALLLAVCLGRPVAAEWDDGIVVSDEQAPLAAPLPGQEPADDIPEPAAAAMHDPAIPFDADPSGCRTLPAGSGDDCGPLECVAAERHARWSFRADALLLWRNAPAPRPIFTTVVPPGGTGLGPTALDADNLDSDVVVAPRMSLFRTDCEGRTFETTYLYAGNFFSERSLPSSPKGYATSPPGIYGNTWGPPTDPATSLDSATATLLGQLHSLEFNLRRVIWPDTCQFLMGARWLQWNETLRMTDSFSTAGPPPTIGNDFYQTRCFNNLWGGQIGLDTLLLGNPGMARIEGLVKAGAYYNAAGQASGFGYADTSPFTYANRARADGPAACSFVGEVGLSAVVPICRSWDFRCGYFGLWLTNLAQPTGQLSNQTINQFDSVAGLSSSGRLVLQGLSLGMESRW